MKFKTAKTFKTTTSKFMPQNLSPKEEFKIVFNKNKDCLRAPNIAKALGISKFPQI